MNNFKITQLLNLSRSMPHTSRFPLRQSLIGTLLILLVAGTACVSVNIGPGKGKKSSGVKFQEPSGSFREIDNDRADMAWLNASTGSSIAFQSNCGDSADASLESMNEELFSGFDGSRKIKSDRTPFDGREALQAEVEGTVDGITTHIHTTVYKKNKCSYILTLVTLPKPSVNLTTDLETFERFKASFRAP
ncbi:MAG: hypothetical protein RBT63_02730 [Bdellovibrionales bacterium]|jgi:hypothetical protein|nr:hypothetical protein [Bdellovibrionales bacterium]